VKKKNYDNSRKTLITMQRSTQNY